MSGFNKSCPVHIANAKYGCIKNSFAEFTSSGGIIPVNGYITWFYDSSKNSETIDNTSIMKGINDAFNLIVPYIGKVRFLNVPSREEAQINIGFYKNSTEGLPQPFGQNTLAYAFLGNGTTAFNIVGDIFFNDENFAWTLGATRTTIDFVRTMTHEVLHSLGLSHQTLDPTGILYPSYNPNVPIKFTQDTIDGLKFIYGDFDGPEDKEPTPPGDNPETNPEDIPEGCLGLLTRLFKSTSELNRLKESQLLVIASELNIEADKKDLKRNTLFKIWSRIKSAT